MSTAPPLYVMPSITTEELNAIVIPQRGSNASANASSTETIGSLSNDHTVLLVFLRSFECAFCKQRLALHADLFQEFIKANCVPVFVHMEDEDTTENFLCQVRISYIFYMQNMRQFLPSNVTVTNELFCFFPRNFSLLC